MEKREREKETEISRGIPDGTTWNNIRRKVSDTIINCDSGVNE